MPSATNDFYDEPDSDCANCGGEGVVYDCIDGQCIDAEYGCDLCASKCDWCNHDRPILTPHQRRATRLSNA